MNHVLLIGFMGAGKSTVARLVATQLGRPCIDLDELIVERDGRPIKQIFDESGEAAFRALESQALRSLVDERPSVVACGGGVILANENRTLLDSLGTVVYLSVSVGETMARVGSDPSRPLLACGALEAGRLLASRESLYASVASLCVDTVGRTPEEVAEIVTSELRTRGVT